MDRNSPSRYNKEMYMMNTSKSVIEFGSTALGGAAIYHN